MVTLNYKSSIKYGICALIFAFIGVLTFFILYNAEWLIGDDASYLRTTAFGISSVFSSVNAEMGFFRPFDDLHYNILLLVHSGMHSALEHYVINAISFLACMAALIGILWCTMKPQGITDYLVILFAIILIVSRIIVMYINVFGPIFGVYTYHMLAVFFLCLFYRDNKLWSMLLSLMCWTYSMLIYENVCVVVLCMGVFPIIFAYNKLNKRQRMYFFSMIILSMAYLLSYLVFIYLPSRNMSHYDPSHGQDISMMKNALNILGGQIVIWFAAIVWLYRQIRIFLYKDEYHVIYDTLLWASGGMVIGGVLLRLNWVMYYYDAIILSLPAILYFGIKKSTKTIRYCSIIMLCVLSLYYGKKVPNVIRENQEDRVQTASAMSQIVKTSNGEGIVWYERDDLQGFDLVIDNWRKDCTKNYIQYLLSDKNWDYSLNVEDAKYILVCGIENKPIDNLSFDLSKFSKIGITSDVSYLERVSVK